MRNPERIDPFLQKLNQLWKSYPDLRFGQLIENVLDHAVGTSSLFFIEDEPFSKAIDSFELAVQLANQKQEKETS